MARRIAHNIGTSIIILSPDERSILVGKRIKNPGAGYQIPGGCIEEGETMKNAAIREIEEETGFVLNPEKVSLSCVIQSAYYGDVHYHVIFSGVADDYVIPENPEPHKCAGWHWYDKKDIPDGVWYRMSRLAIDNYLSGNPKVYIEDNTEVGKI